MCCLTLRLALVRSLTLKDSYGKGRRCTHCHRSDRLSVRVSQRRYAHWPAHYIRPGGTGRFPVLVCRHTPKVSNSTFFDSCLRNTDLAPCTLWQFLPERDAFRGLRTFLL